MPITMIPAGGSTFSPATTYTWTAPQYFDVSLANLYGAVEAVAIQATVEPPSDSTANFRVLTLAATDDTDTEIGSMVGLDLDVQRNRIGAAGSVDGIRANVHCASASGNVAAGTFTATVENGGETLGTCGALVASFTLAGQSTVDPVVIRVQGGAQDDGYALEFAGIKVENISKANAATIGTAIGLDVADQTGGGVNYSIRTGSAPCQFRGSIDFQKAIEMTGVASDSWIQWAGNNAALAPDSVNPPISGAGINFFNPTVDTETPIDIQNGSITILKGQQAAIADAAPGTEVATINAILAILRGSTGHGLIAG